MKKKHVDQALEGKKQRLEGIGLKPAIAKLLIDSNPMFDLDELSCKRVEEIQAKLCGAKIETIKIKDEMSTNEKFVELRKNVEKFQTAFKDKTKALDVRKEMIASGLYSMNSSLSDFEKTTANKTLCELQIRVDTEKSDMEENTEYLDAKEALKELTAPMKECLKILNAKIDLYSAVLRYKQPPAENALKNQFKELFKDEEGISTELKIGPAL